MQVSARFRRLEPGKVRDVIQARLEPAGWRMVLPLYVPIFADKIIAADEIIHGNESAGVVAACTPNSPMLKYGSLEIMICIWQCFRGKGLGREVLTAWAHRSNGFVRVWEGNSAAMRMLVGLPNWGAVGLVHDHYIFRNLW